MVVYNFFYNIFLIMVLNDDSVKFIYSFEFIGSK